MANIFDYANSYKAATQVCTQDAFERMLDSDKVRQLCEETASIMARWTPSMTDEEYHQLKNEAALPKKKLPVLMPHAHFTDGHRHKESAQESQLMSMDFDGIENPVEVWKKDFENKVDELRIYLAFISPSRKGIKIISQVPDGMTREVAQKWFSEIVGIDDYDHTHDLARCVYMVSRDSLLYYNPDKLFAEKLPSFKVKNVKKVSSVEKFEKKERKVSYRNIKYDPTRKFRGVLYSDIVKAILNAKYGFDEPPVGERHKTIMELALNMMYICDFDKDVMMAVLPRFGKTDGEIADIVRDTLAWRKKNYSPYTPKMVQEITDNLNSGKTMSEELVKADPFLSRPKLPKKLPPILKTICSKVIPEYKPAVLNQAMTAMMSHLHDVEFRYINNSVHEPCSMSVVVGPPSIGKGCVVKPIEYITADMKRSDEVNRARQQEWRDSQQGKGDEERTFEPKDIYILMPMLDLTAPALADRLDRLNRNGKRVLFWKMNEIEMLLQISTKQIPIDKLICLIFDRDEYGQERVSAEAVNVCAPLRMNLIASTTEQNVRLFLKNSLLNGTLSRLCFTMIHFMNESDQDSIPMYGDYDDAYMAALQPCIDNLNDASGLIESRKVKTLIEELMSWCVSEAYCYNEGDERDIYRELYKRALRIAFDKAMTLYIMNGHKWDETCSDYIRYTLADDLWCKMYLFSDMMLAQKRQLSDTKGLSVLKAKESKTKMLYNALPVDEIIDYKVIDNLKLSFSITQPAKQLVYQFKQYGIEKIDSKHWIKRHEEDSRNEEQ